MGLPYPPQPYTSLTEFPTALGVGEVFYNPVLAHDNTQMAQGKVRTTKGTWTYPQFLFEVMATQVSDDYLAYLRSFYTGVLGTKGRFLWQNWLEPDSYGQALFGVPGGNFAQGDGVTTVFKANGDQFDSAIVYLNGVATYSLGASSTGFMTLPYAPTPVQIVTADIINEKFRMMFMDTVLNMGSRNPVQYFRYGPFEIHQSAAGAKFYDLTYRLMQIKEA